MQLLSLISRDTRQDEFCASSAPTLRKLPFASGSLFHLKMILTHEAGNNRACSSRFQPSRATRRRLPFLCVVLPTAFALYGTRTSAWVFHPSSEKLGRRVCGGDDGKRRYPPVSTRTTRPRPAASNVATARAVAALRSTSVEGDGSEGIEALEAKGAVPVSEGEEISMDVKRSSWREEFASLRNDAADPWSARIGADGRESKSSGSVKNEPSASFATPEKKNGSGGGQADTAGVEASPATAEDLANQADPVPTSAAAAAGAPTASPQASAAPAAPVATAGGAAETGETAKTAKTAKTAPIAAKAAPTTAKATPKVKEAKPKAAAATADEDGRSVAEEAAEIMSSRGESDTAAAHRAYLLLDAELASTSAAAAAASPPTATQDVETTSPQSQSRPVVAALSRSTAEALLSWIRCSTAGNGLVVADNGRAATADTPERQELWGEHAPRVLQLVKEAGQSPSSSPELQQIYTEAVMYSVSSQGILEAFVSGKALAFTSAMNALAKKFPEQDNGVAFIFQGSYFLAAPWPIRNPKKARECYEKAVEINRRSRRNAYYAGLGRLECGDKKGAAEMFRRAVSDEHCESASATERDIAVSLREQAQRGLDACG